MVCHGISRSAGLDVVRALAIGMVLASHCGGIFGAWLGYALPWQVAVGGFFGVELFFVLSGFLIGGLLLDIIETAPDFRAWRVFMARRWLRTLPLYAAWLVVLAVLWPPDFWVPGHRALWWHLAQWGTLTQNLAWRMPDGWFAVSWSLAVEEWFYLGFSALLLTLAVRLGRRRALALSVGLFLLLPPMLRLAMPATASFDEAISKIVVLRLDAIAWGVAAIWAMRGRTVPRWLLAAMLAVGVMLVVAVWRQQLERLPWPGALFRKRVLLFDVTSLGFALCLPAAARLVRLPLAWLARAISAQSYGIYLMHLSILEIVGFWRDRWHVPAIPTVAVCVALIWGLSWASWRWFERPILARRPVQRVPGTT